MIITILFFQSSALFCKIVCNLHDNSREFRNSILLIMYFPLFIHLVKERKSFFLKEKHSFSCGIFDKSEVPIFFDCFFIFRFDPRICKSVNSRGHLIRKGKSTFLFIRRFQIMSQILFSFRHNKSGPTNIFVLIIFF